MIAFAFLLFWFATPSPDAQIHGRVRDAQNGEALTKVSVKLVETGRHAVTDASGTFHLSGIAPGKYRLLISSVGYGLLERKIVLSANDLLNVDLALSPEALQHKDSVEVVASPFSMDSETSATAFTLSGSEAKNLASVLADDPMRALQSAPGVSGNDDFDSRFSLHGAPFDQIGLYLDGILLHEPFHTVQGEGPSGSTAVFNGDMVAGMTLQSENYGAQFENRTAGVVNVETREGSTDRMHLRFNASVPDAGVLAEGPFSKSHKGSWLVSARKSYLQYFLKDLSQDVGSLAFGFMDTQAQFNYQLTDSNAFSFKLLDGTSDLDRSNSKSTLGLNAAEYARYHYTLVNVGWRLTPNHSFVLNTKAAFTRERYDNDNIFDRPLGNGYYGEWLAKSDAAWAWADNAQLQLGAVARPAHAEGFASYYLDHTDFVNTNSYRGADFDTGGYAQQEFTRLIKGLSFSIGGRWDRLSANRQSALSPQASVAYQAWTGAKFSFAWGRYAQFPELSSLYAENGSPRLLPAQADHLSAAFEQRLGQHSRFRLSAFQRNDRNLLFQPLMDARVTDGVVSPDFYQSPIMNALSGVSRAAEIFFQRRTANGWTGWVSYTLSRSEMFDRSLAIRFPSDQDQRHTFNSYASYRLRPSVNLSAKFSFGSGFPVPGFFLMQDGSYYLAATRNAVRLPPYERLDIRMNKSKTFEHAKMTLFVEVVNVLDHANYRFDSYNGFDPATRRAYISLSQMFPTFPSAGIAVAF